MLAEFIQFVDSVLPSVDPDFRDGAINAIKQFEKNGDQIRYVSNDILDDLSQGDILSKVPFSYFDEKGQQNIFLAEAMVLTTSCHIDHKDKIELVPIFPISTFDANGLQQLKNNIIFDYMYIPDDLLADKYISFEYISAYSKDLIVNGIESKKITRLGSLNQIGYYFFIIKLSVFFFKTEDKDTLFNRGVGFSY